MLGALRAPLRRVPGWAWAVLGTAAVAAGLALSASVGADLFLGPFQLQSNPEPWPVDGSFATYQVYGSGGSPMGDYFSSFEGNVTLTFRDGAWSAHCVAIEHEHDEYAIQPDRYQVVERHADFSPPLWPTQVEAGQNVTAEVLGQCGLEPFSTQVVGQSNFDYGGGNNIEAWHAYQEPCPCQGYEAMWARDNGLLLSWSFGGRAGGSGGQLIASDAPGISSK